MPTFVSKERISRCSLLGSGAVSTQRSLAHGECHNLQKVPFHGAFLEAPDGQEINSLMAKRTSLEQALMSIGPSRHLMRRSEMSEVWGNPEVAGACSKRRD